ncbi:MAG: response regulator [Candidatus Marinarcus sp.]|uniref:response regulator n=1 Tax=Candidatus Marinarcus sp. TaxID=3100987 RepID=UPI003AFFE46C
MQNRDLDILKDLNILYLEDDINLLTHTKDILEDFVHHVHAVQSSKEAWEILKNEKIDVIISDILLENESGIDFLAEVKDANIQLPIILTTAHTDTQYFLDAIKLRVENYIVKPINIKELLESLHDILLPIIQKKEIIKNINVIKTISAVTDSIQVDVVKYIISNLDENDTLVASYSDIMNNISISKPTLIKLFKELNEKNILVKTAHKTYKFNAHALDGF